MPDFWTPQTSTATASMTSLTCFSSSATTTNKAMSERGFIGLFGLTVIIHSLALSSQGKVQA
jgi:hypothetical protein